MSLEDVKSVERGVTRQVQEEPGWIIHHVLGLHPCIKHIAGASSGISQVHQRVMHQPINERVTNLVATRQETTMQQIHKYANTQIQVTTLEKIHKYANTQIQETSLEQQQQPALPHQSLALSPLIKQEGLAGGDEGKANDQKVHEQEAASSLERGEINPKVEISDGASLVCRTCNKVRLNKAFSLSQIQRN